MLVKNSKAFNIGLLLITSFAVVFYVIMFMPIFNGRTPIIYADDMFNSLSKGSTYFIPELQKKAQEHVGQPLDMTFKMAKPAEAEKAAMILEKNGVKAVAAGEKVTITGADLGQVMLAVSADSDLLFHDKGQDIKAKYGYDGRETMYIWHSALKGIKKQFDEKASFAESAFVDKIMTKVIEPGYNFYGIKSEKIKDHVALVVALLTFYVIYTLWFGYSIYELFNGMGLTMTKSKVKKE